MRKLSFIMILLFCATLTYAQKGKVAQAASYFTTGKLDEAKKLIDEAITHEACVDYDKAYFTKGQIYQGIYESQEYKKLDPQALDKAWEAYQKVIELDVKNKYTKKLATQYQNLIVDFTNQAVEYYSAENFKEALRSFKQVLAIENSPILTEEAPAKIDTAVMFNAGVSAQRAGEFADAEKFYKDALKYNYEPARTYAMLANVLKEQGKEEEAIQYLHKGYELFPDNAYMLVELINYYLLGGQPEKAEVYLDAAIKQDPKNASFYRAKGTLYEKMNKPDQAIEMYQKTLELDPKDFAAQFNISNSKLTKVSEFHKKVEDILDVNEYNKEVAKVLDQYEALIPDFEKALSLKPNDKNTLMVLKELYFRVRTRDAKYEAAYDATKEKLDKLDNM